jgi:hypothetical protein
MRQITRRSGFPAASIADAQLLISMCTAINFRRLETLLVFAAASEQSFERTCTAQQQGDWHQGAKPAFTTCSGGKITGNAWPWNRPHSTKPRAGRSLISLPKRGTVTSSPIKTHRVCLSAHHPAFPRLSIADAQLLMSSCSPIDTIGLEWSHSP